MRGADIRSAKPPSLTREDCEPGVCSIVAASSLAMLPWQIPAGSNRDAQFERQLPSCPSGQAFSISQRLEDEKRHKGEHGNGHLTSAGPPWNMLGVLYDWAIDWSNCK
jgi:hypothetical protein